MICIARNANAFMSAADQSARYRSWWWLILMPVLFACLPISSQAQSATAKLSVTVTVVPSTYIIFLPDGSTKVIVANGHESDSATNLQSPPESAASPTIAADKKSVPLTLPQHAQELPGIPGAPAESQGAKRTHRRVKP